LVVNVFENRLFTRKKTGRRNTYYLTNLTNNNMKKRQSVHGNAKIPMQITAIIILQHKFLAFFAK